jgi:hypothetical protein
MKRDELTMETGYTVHDERSGPFSRVLVYRFNTEESTPHPLTPWVVWNVAPDGSLDTGGYYSEHWQARRDFDGRDAGAPWNTWGNIIRMGAAFAHRNSGIFDGVPDHEAGCECPYCAESEAFGVRCDDFGAPFTVAPDYD